MQEITSLDAIAASLFEHVYRQLLPSELILLFIPEQIVHFLDPLDMTYAYPTGQEKTQLLPS